MLGSISSIKKAYLAGFLDADGSIYVRAKPNLTYKYGYQIALYIVFFQSVKDKDKFIKICGLSGVGKTRERKDGIVEFIINKIDEVKQFLKIITPLSYSKKRTSGIND